MLASALPFMSRPHALLELRAWALLAVPTGVLTGGVTGVLIHSVFADAAPDWLLGVAMALVTGAGPIANVSSALWARWSQCRDKVIALIQLQAAFAACLLAAAVAPPTLAGLLVLVVMTLAARTTWCGTLTIRAIVWRANYDRRARTWIAANTQIVVAIIMATVGALAGFALDLDAENYRWLYGICALVGLVGMLVLRRLKVRRQRQLLSSERARSALAQRPLPNVYLAILRDDHLYRKYLACLMVLGSGTMMLTAPLILVLTNTLGADRFTQVLISTAIPMVLMPITTPLWARSLDSRHVITFRAINSCVHVAATAALLAGAVLAWLPLLWGGAVLLGIAQGGSVLSWSLGHNDFAGDSQVAEYVGLHVTLTGVRGLFAPLLGVAAYFGLEHQQAGGGVWALAFPLLLTIAGTIGFFRLSRDPKLDAAMTP